MTRIERHILRRTAVQLTAIIVTLTAIVWVTQVLKRFDLVTAQGQAIATFLSMTLLALPYLLIYVAPFALVFAMVAVLNTMHADSEVVALTSSGAGRRIIARPFLTLALVVSALVAALLFEASPRALRALADYTSQVRADVVANVIQPGRFTSIEDGFTFHIGDRELDGTLTEIFFHDGRDPDLSFTYTAERGRVEDAFGRTLIVMQNGTIERTDGEGATTFIGFDAYAFDLSALQPEDAAATYDQDELSLPDLFAWKAPAADVEVDGPTLRAELHGRLSSALYPLAMALAVLAFVAPPRSNRSGRGFAVFAALLAAGLIRLAGFSLQGAAAAAPLLLPLLYAVPVAAILAFGALFARGREFATPAILSRVGGRLRGLRRRPLAAGAGAP